VASALLLGAASVNAQLVMYDDFSGKELDSARWRGVKWGEGIPLEIARQVERGALVMHLRDNPGEEAAQGLTFNKAGADVNRLTSVRAYLTIGSTTPEWWGDVGLVGTWYCSGTCDSTLPPPRRFIDNVIVNLFMNPSWEGPKSGLTASYRVGKCLAPDCSGGPMITGVLATNLRLNEPHRIGIALDPITKMLTFEFDGLKVTPVLPKDLQHTSDIPGWPFKTLLMESKGLGGAVTASFDRVLVNPEY
jgi:hypothetical protein